MFDFYILQTWAEKNPDALAFVDDQVQVSWKDFNSFVLRTAAFFNESGIRKDMIVNIHLPSFLNWTSTLALHILGITSISRKNVSNSNPWLIHDFHLSLEEDPAIPNEQNLIFNESIVQRIKDFPEYNGPFGFNSDSDVARLIPTSGTTGDTKFVAVKAGDLEALARQKSSWDFQGDGKVLGLFPMGARQSYRFALSLLQNGKTLYRTDYLDYRVAKFLRRNPIHSVFGSPQQALKMLESIKHTGSVLPELKTIALSGSSPIPTLVERIKNELHCDVFNVYGSTEVGNVGIFKLGEKSPDGFKLNDDVELQIVDEQGRQVEQKYSGLIRYKNRNLSIEYFRNEKANQEFFKEGFFYPGDIGYLNDEGLLYLDGRSQDVLNLGGVKFNPEKLDQIVQSQLGVVDAAVFSLHTENGSDQLALAVVVDDDFDLETFNKVISKKFPAKVDFLFNMESLPRNEAGKINRRELSETHRLIR